MVEVFLKTCRCCSLDKPLSDFYHAPTGKDGLNARCKACIRKAYELATKNKVTRRNKTTAYMDSLGERGVKSPKDYMAQAWYREREWRKLKLEAGLCTRCGEKPLWNKTSCMDCHEQRTKSQKEKEAVWVAKGLCKQDGADPADAPSFYCAYHLALITNRSRYLRRQVIKAYGGKCACCGETQEKFLTIDHVNNDGNVDRKNKGESGSSLYKHILKVHRLDLQLLCWNCNIGKHQNGGECPHVFSNPIPQADSEQDWYALA